MNEKNNLKEFDDATNSKNELRDKIFKCVNKELNEGTYADYLTDELVPIIQPELDAKDELISAYESVKAPHACVPNLCGQLKELKERIKELEGMTEGYSNWVTEVIEGHPELFDID